jgi:hypothetical protein
MNHDTQSLRRASLTAGITLALIIVLATFGAVGALVTPGDAAKTAQDILGSEGLFRWGIASLILVVILDIVVAAALLTVFEPAASQPWPPGSEPPTPRSIWWRSASSWWRLGWATLTKPYARSTPTTRAGTSA